MICASSINLSFTSETLAVRAVRQNSNRKNLRSFGRVDERVESEGLKYASRPIAAASTKTRPLDEHVPRSAIKFLILFQYVTVTV